MASVSQCDSCNMSFSVTVNFIFVAFSELTPHNTWLRGLRLFEILHFTFLLALLKKGVCLFVFFLRLLCLGMKWYPSHSCLFSFKCLAL